MGGYISQTDNPILSQKYLSAKNVNLLTLKSSHHFSSNFYMGRNKLSLKQLSQNSVCVEKQCVQFRAEAKFYQQAFSCIFSLVFFILFPESYSIHQVYLKKEWIHLQGSNSVRMFFPSFFNRVTLKERACFLYIWVEGVR